MTLCSAPNCDDEAVGPHRLMSISADPLSFMPHAGETIAIVPIPYCDRHRIVYRHQMQASSQRLSGRMMLASLIDDADVADPVADLVEQLVDDATARRRRRGRVR